MCRVRTDIKHRIPDTEILRLGLGFFGISPHSCSVVELVRRHAVGCAMEQCCRAGRVGRWEQVEYLSYVLEAFDACETTTYLRGALEFGIHRGHFLSSSLNLFME